MKYENLELNYRAGSLIIKDSKEVRIINYPRIHKSDAQLMQYNPTTIICTLIIRNWNDYVSLKLLDRASEGKRLYLNMEGDESHYYENVLLELGDIQRRKPGLFFLSATFTALDPFLYDADSEEVVF